MSILSKLGNSLFSVQAIAQFEQLQSHSASKSDTNAVLPPSEPAALVQLSSGPDVSNLEKHISDYEAGHGNLSERYYGTLARREAETSYVLSNANPDAAALYSSYSTLGLEYGQHARFVTTTNQSSKHAADLLALAEQLDETA